MESLDSDHLQANLACGNQDGPWAGRVKERIRWRDRATELLRDLNNLLFISSLYG